jgi:hypothetical protein
VPFPNKATQFRPGQSGNPGGRPKKQSLTAQLRAYLDREAKVRDKPRGHGIRNRDILIERLFQQAVDGDTGLIRLIFERVDGKLADVAEEDTGTSMDPTTAARVLRAVSGDQGPPVDENEELAERRA